MWKFRNDGKFYLYKGSGTCSWVSTPCLLQDISHIHWFLPLKQSTRKKRRIKKMINHKQIVSCSHGLLTQNPRLREVDLEPSPKRGSGKMKTLRQWKRTTTENKSYRTAWTPIRECSTLKSKLRTRAKNGQEGQAQQFLCTINELKWLKTNKTTQERRNRHSNTHVLFKGARVMTKKSLRQPHNQASPFKELKGDHVIAP